jgi:ankyrin repeat protein
MLLAGVTPLHFAVSHEQVTAVRYFLEKGADPNIKDSSNGTASLHEAAALGVYFCTFYSVVNDY